MSISKKWVTSKEAAAILSEQSGHIISDAYVRRLGNTQKLTTSAIDGRTKLYLRSDVERYIVKKRGNGDVRRAIRRKKEEPSLVA